MRGRWPTVKRGVLGWVILAASLAIIAFFAWVVAVPFPEAALVMGDASSTRIVDREGRLLYDVPTTGDTRGRWRPLAAISPHLAQATIDVEDRRFRDHAGIDGFAILRSVWVNLTSGEVKTGASTITQQTVKLTLQKGAPRSFETKLMEAVWAWRLEHAHSKDEILEQYLNRAPYGNQLVGCEAAAEVYFGTSADQLSLAQAAFLAGIPQSPGRFDPYRNFARTTARQQRVLAAMHANGSIDDVALRLALAEPLTLRPKRPPHEAPHLTARIAHELRALPDALRRDVVPTTIARDTQRAIERLLATQQPEAAQRGDFQAAAIVLDTQTSEVLAWVGSRAWSDRDALGANDGITARRQPGSALKPFIYALFLEDGHPITSTFADVPTAFETPTGRYRPQNYDRTFHGTVSLRTALGSSLNVPAIAALATVGVGRALDFLHRLGLATLDRGADDYGLGLALGDGDIRLVDLANAYATLGRLGQWRPVRWDASDTATTTRRVFSPETARALLDILADDRARGIGFGFAGPLALPYRVAAKTGTSSDYRDNWAFGVTPRYTVGVWVGNFDGHPMNRVSGPIGASPLLRQIFQILNPHAATAADISWFAPPFPSPPLPSPRAHPREATNALPSP